jgi:hypothetical protein
MIMEPLGMVNTRDGDGSPTAARRTTRLHRFTSPQTKLRGTPVCGPGAGWSDGAAEMRSWSSTDVSSLPAPQPRLRQPSASVVRVRAVAQNRHLLARCRLLSSPGSTISWW